MVKKIILRFFITSLIMIGVFGLVGCDDDPLKSYKDLGKTEIQTYADAKGQDNYSTDDWAVICNTVATGKAAVDAAESTDEVDNAVTTTKAEINKVQQKELGMFYTLQEAFDNGWLTKEDLQIIAYYLNDDSGPAYSDDLSAEIEKTIKKTWAYNLRTEVNVDGDLRFPDAKEEDVSLIGYYGNYNNLFAVMCADNFTFYTLAEWSEIIDEVTFHYVDGNRIWIWKEKTNGLE